MQHQVEQYPAIQAPGFSGFSKSGPGHCSLCGPFLNIEPLIDLPEGRYINPLFDAVKVFELALEPFPVNLAPGQAFDAQLVAQAEENHFGDLLVSDLLGNTTPTEGRHTIEFFSQQNDRSFQNAPVLDRFILSDGHQRYNNPACFLIQATNFVQTRVTNIGTVPTEFRLIASGRRLLPYQYPGLRDQFLAFWDAQRSIPFWLTFDRVLSATAGGGAIPGSGLRINPGETVSALMTIPGSGDFEVSERLTLVDGVGGAADARDVLVRVSEGVGRALMSRPVPLSLYAQPNLLVAGFQDGEYRAASGGHSKFFSQFFKRNSRIRFEVTNNNAVPIDFFFCYRGVQHYYDECAPGRGLQRALSLEPTVSPRLVQSPRCPPVHAFEPVPGQGLQPVTQSPVGILPPTGFTPPIPQPQTGQRVSAPMFPNGQQPMQGMSGNYYQSDDFGIG